ncbi:MAG: MFS transporter [Gemmataceae bacterium]|nr:MFS transporter [Gemmataceae bacterium]MCI0741406.1 MFS transporter [Gemmataceae bacterium]
MLSARLRLSALWVAHVTRVLADNALRILVALHLARQGDRDGAWHVVTLLLILPAVVLAPLNGALCNSLPKQRVLWSSAAWAALIVSAVFFAPTRNSALNPVWMLIGWAGITLSSAVNSPVRFAFLPAAAQDTRWPLTRLNAFFEMGSGLAIVGGLTLGALLADGSTGADAVFVGLFALPLVFSFVVWFPSDVVRPETPRQALAGFFRDFRRILLEKEARGCMLGLASLRGLMTALMGALLASAVDGGAGYVQQLLEIGLWIMAGVAAGSLLAGLQKHPRRILGLVPWGSTGMALGLLLVALGGVPGPVLCVFLGILAGLVNVPLAATYQAALPADGRGNGMAARNFADYLVTALVAGLFFVLTHAAGMDYHGQFWLVFGAAAVLAVLSWRFLLREVAELLTEFIIWPMYRIRVHGPGVHALPERGPVLVIANHSAWLDPVWMGKVLPRRIIPMMTSVFYDLPILRWVMENLAQAIRVQAATFRREVPELKEAIKVLDSGSCLMVFPEGGMRKKEVQLVKNFGQGVWHILNERPDTPVVCCWIEGGWGCYFSYKNGPPTKNKRLDFWRRIDVAVSEPMRVPTEILTDHRATRQYLMQSCLNARGFLGLEVPNLELGKAEETKTE